MSILKIQAKDYSCRLFPFVREDCLSIQEVKQNIGWSISAFDLPKAWEWSQGDGVTIAVIDTGSDLDHTDLVDNLVPGYNVFDEKAPPEDDNGHGCVSPDCMIHTNLGGIQEIKTLYESIDTDELLCKKSEGMYFIKKTPDLKTYSLDTIKQESVIGEIESIQKLPIDGDIIRVELEGGTVYRLTPWHPVYLIKNRHHKVYDIVRKRADKIESGDQFIFGRDSTCGTLGSIRGHRVNCVSKEHYKGWFYDFTVKDYHNYIADGHFVSNTHVTGTLVAVNNDIGMVGVCPKSKVMPIKALDKDGNGNMLNIAKAIRWAVDHGADFISMSLGAPIPVAEVRNAIKYAHSKGVITFVAAGNVGNTKEVFYPAAYPETIAVGAVDQSLRRSSFSNTGRNLDFMAPGVDIYSTVPDSWYAKMSGTCIAEGSYVYTENGPIQIEHIAQGDCVFSYNDGQLVKALVSQNHYRGVNNLLELKSGGRKIRVTQTHEMLAINCRKREIEWIEAQKISDEHKLLIPRFMKPNVNEYLNNLISTDFAWFLGFIIGDGWISHAKNGMRVNFATGNKQEVIDEILRIYSHTCGKVFKTNKNDCWRYDDNTKMTIILECLGLNEYAVNKTIPNFIWSLEQEKIMAFYKGYRTADGYVYKNSSYKVQPNSFECCSNNVIRKICCLADYMGWQHTTLSTRQRINQTSNKKNSDLKISFATQVIRKPPDGGWSCLKKYQQSGEQVARDMGIDTNSFFLAKVKVSNTNVVSKVYDLSVPDTNCFVTEGLITHNSMAQPFVCGVAALVKSFVVVKNSRPDIELKSAIDYRKLLMEHTIPVNNGNYDDPKFYQGFGIIDPRKFMESIKH